MIDLEVGLLFTDNYVDRIGYLVNKVHEAYPTVKITLLNNSSTDIDAPEYCKVIKNTSDNKYTLYSRKLVVEQSTSEYMWFIDEDDDITYANLDELTNEADIHEFLYELKASENESFHYLKNDCTLWTRFIRTSILKDIYSHVTIEHKVICSEDTFAVSASKSAQYNAKIENHDIEIYVHNAFLGSSGIVNYDDNIELYRKTLFGRPTVCMLRDTYYPDVEEDYGAHYYFIKLYNTKNLDTQREMLNILQETGGLTVQEIAALWKDSSAFLEKEDWLERKALLNEMFPDNKDDFFFNLLRWDEKEIVGKNGNKIIISVNERRVDLY